jgi:hypothetical protein
MRRIIFVIILFLGMLVLLTRFTAGTKLFFTLQEGIWWWVDLAIIIEVIYLLNQGAFYTSLYHFFGVRDRFKHIFNLTLAYNFVSVVLPGGNLSGSALIVHDAICRGMEASRAIMLNFIYSLLSYTCFILILSLGFFYLITKNMLHLYETITAFLLLTLVLAQIFILLIAYFKPTWLIHFAASLARGLNWLSFPFVKRTILEPGQATSFAEEFGITVKFLTERWQKLWRSVTFAFLGEILRISILGILFLAFRQQINLGNLIAGYAVGILFVIISVTPGGTGIMEGIMAVVFASLGVPFEKAVVVTFAYRGITFWLPFVLGIFGLRRAKKT